MSIHEYCYLAGIAVMVIVGLVLGKRTGRKVDQGDVIIYSLIMAFWPLVIGVGGVALLIFFLITVVCDQLNVAK